MGERLPAVVRDAMLEGRTLWRDAEPGQCRLVRDGNDLVVAQADPVVWVTDEFLHTLSRQQKHRSDQLVTLTWGPVDICDPKYCCQMFKNGPCFTGAILEIDAKNDKVFYRIGRYLRVSNSWVATQA